MSHRTSLDTLPLNYELHMFFPPSAQRELLFRNHVCLRYYSEFLDEVFMWYTLADLGL
jgi:hypothetical protein